MGKKIDEFENQFHAAEDRQGAKKERDRIFTKWLLVSACLQDGETVLEKTLNSA